MAVVLSEFLLPFFFTFAVVYGSLQLSKVFDRKVSTIIGLVLAGFTVTNQQVVDWINTVLPYAAIFFVVVFFIGFIVSALTDKEKKKVDYTLVVIVLALVLLFLAAQGGELLSGVLPRFTAIDADGLVFLAGAFLVVVILFAVYKAAVGGEK